LRTWIHAVKCGELARATGAPFEHRLYLGYQFAAYELLRRVEREERVRLRAKKGAKSPRKTRG
jgi:hypothetical protein